MPGLAGGADDDTLFGQGGNDTLQGDGSITLAISAGRDADGLLVVTIAGNSGPAWVNTYTFADSVDSLFARCRGALELLGVLPSLRWLRRRLESIKTSSGHTPPLAKDAPAVRTIGNGS